MRILLFGEFSGLHTNLKEGLESLGHEVVLASGKDGFKGISSDIFLDSTLAGLAGKVEARVKPFLKLPRLCRYDVVQAVNPFFPNAKFFPKHFFYRLLQKFNDRFFILAAGSDAFYWRHARPNLRYGPFEDFLKYDVGSEHYYMNSNSALRYNEAIVEMADGVIPVLYEYEEGYRGCRKRMPTIPLPINTDRIIYQENKLSKKLVVFHGLTRYGFKGTRHVEAAFDELRKRYPNDLRLVIDGRVPLTQYMEMLESCNVVIDQLNTYSSGMNGLFALALGKVVLGGAEPEGLFSLRQDWSPIINVTPSKKSVVTAIQNLLDQRDQIPTVGYQGRRFVEQHHNYVKIAQQYVDTWSNSQRRLEN